MYVTILTSRKESLSPDTVKRLIISLSLIAVPIIIILGQPPTLCANICSLVYISEKHGVVDFIWLSIKIKINRALLNMCIFLICLMSDKLWNIDFHLLQDIEVGKAVRPQLALRVGNAAAAWKKVCTLQSYCYCQDYGNDFSHSFFFYV